MPMMLVSAVYSEVFGSPLIVLYIDPFWAYLCDLLLNINTQDVVIFAQYIVTARFCNT